MFDLYSDFAFLTIAHSQKDLGTFFVLSMTSFVMIMVPKVLSFWLVLKILCMSSNQKKHGMLASSAYYEDLRRKMIFRAFTFSEFRSQALCVDYINYEIYKTEFLMACVKFGIEDLPQFIIQTLYLLTTTCGVKNSNTIVYMSVCSTVLSSYWGFLYRLSLYLYKRKRLHAYERKVEISISSDTLENYGFKHVRRMLPYNNHLQSFLLSGSSHEYFYCNERRLQKTESMIKTMPVQRIAFFELDRCNFNFPYEPQILFNFLRNQVIFENLRYLSVQRCKFCKGFLTPALTNFLNEDNNLIRFSFVHNNQDSLIKNNEEDPDSSKRKNKASVRISQLVEQEISQAGFLTDFQIMQVLDAATLHPKLEIIQIAQCMQDYFEAYEYVLYHDNIEENDPLSTFARSQNEKLEFQEHQRRLRQQKMFSQEEEKRQQIYQSIFENLTIARYQDGLSSLRRLELRYLPLDPLLVAKLFEALEINFVLQELILTDDCLQYCGIETFKPLFSALASNRRSALTLLDFSRNFYAVDKCQEFHKDLVEAIPTQKTVSPQEESSGRNANASTAKPPAYLEQVIFTTKSEAIEMMYFSLMNQGDKSAAELARIRKLKITINKDTVITAVDAEADEEEEELAEDGEPDGDGEAS